MSEQIGNNPRVTENSAAPSPEMAASVATKGALRDAKAELSAAKGFDATLVRRAKTVQNGLIDLGQAIADAKSVTLDNGVKIEPWRLVLNGEGKPFKSWQTYLSDRLEAFPMVSKMASRQMCERLITEGLSVREAAKAAKVSASTAGNIKAEVEGRKARPASVTGEKAKVDDKAKVAKALTAYLAAAKALNAVLDNLSPGDLDKVIDLSKTTNGQAVGIKTQRAKVAKAKLDAAKTAGKPAAPKPAAPAPVAAPEPVAV